MNEGLEFDVASDIDYEDLIADIGVGTELFAIINQEKGFENLEIRIYPRHNNMFWEFEIVSIVNTIEEVKKRLSELQKNS